MSNSHNNNSRPKLKGTDDFYGAAFYRLAMTGVVNKSELRYCRQETKNGSWYPEWRKICDGNYAGVLSSATTSDGRMATVVVTGDTKKVHFLMQLRSEDVTGTDPVSWYGPVDLGAPDGASNLTQIGLNRGHDDLMNVFAVNDHKDVYWKTQNPMETTEHTEQVTPPGSDEAIDITVEEETIPEEAWSDWMKLPNKVSGVVGVKNQDGTILLCGIESSSNKVFTIKQSASDPQSLSAWGSWTEISGVTAEQIMPVVSRHGLINILIVTPDGDVKVAIQSGLSSKSFEVKTALPSAPTPAKYLKPILDSEGYIAIVAQGEVSSERTPVYMIMETSQGDLETPAEWGDWQEIAQLGARSQASIRIQCDGKLVLFDRQRDSLKLRALTQTQAHSMDWPDDSAWVTIGENIVRFGQTIDFTA